MSKKIVSVQDISCYGQCSLTVAQPILSAYGIETAILPSAILSTHTGGFTGFTCLDLTEEMPKIVDHWMKEGIAFDAIYSGYIGDARQFDLIGDMKQSVLTPGGKLIVDPAMADHGKLYAALDETIVAGMRALVQKADVILPNLTEAAFLLDIPFEASPDRATVEAMVKALSDMGPELVILTGVSYEEGKIGAVAWDKTREEYTEVFADHQPRNYHGTGDTFSSIVVAGLVNGESLEAALQEACLFVVDCIKNTMPDDSHGYGVKFEEVLARRQRS